MADVTGGTPPTGGDEFKPHEDIAEAYTHFGDGSMFSRANAAALPSSGNWPGRLLMTEDDGAVWRWNGSWKKIAWDTGDQNITYATGWSTDSVQGTYRVVNGMCSLNGRIKATAGAGGDAFTTLPVGARPASERVTLGFNAGNYQTIIIGTSGAVSVFGRGTSAMTDLRLATIPPFPVA